MKHVLFLLLLLPLLAGAGAPDLREVQWQQAYGVTQRWDNVEGPPAWIAGNRPQWRLRDRLHAVRLAPGEWTEVRLDANTHLRLHAVDSAATASLHFEVSPGSGLYLRRKAETLADGDLLLEARGGDPWLARITLAADAAAPVEFSLFRSRLVTLPAIEPYRHQVDRKAADDKLRYRGEPGNRRFHRVAGGEPVELRVDGPARYRLQQRLLLDGGGSGARNYQLVYRLDDGPARQVDAAVAVARRQQVLLDGNPVAVSHLRNDYIDVPAGRHRLWLQFSEDVLLRVLASRPDDYLLDGLNVPAHRPAPDPVTDPWTLDMEQLQRALQPGAPLETLYQGVMRIIVDNRRPGGGLVGPMTLLAIARAQPDAPALLKEAQVLLKRHSYYDDLLPASANADSRQLRFATRRLREPRDDTDRYLLQAAEQPALADALETAWFTPLAGGETLPFPLPARPADSLLRVVVADPAPGATLEVIMDDRPPYRLRLDDIPPPATDRHAVDAAAALAARSLQAAGDHPWQLPVRQARPAAVLELHLPRDVQRLRIRRSDDHHAPLRVAMQYRVARPYRLSDASYTRLLDTLRAEGLLQPLWRACLEKIDTVLDPDSRIPEQLLDGRSLSPRAGAAARALVNHWVPLLRWLRARQQTYRATIDDGWQPPQHRLATRELNDILARAKRAEHAGHWLAALEQWRRLADSRDARHRQAALSGRVRALQALREYPLAEQLLRGSYLLDTPPDREAQRFLELHDLYRQQNNTVALEGLLATALSRAPDPARLAALVTRLVEAGRLQEALTAGLLLPAEQRPRAQLLAAALARRAWDSFDRLLATVDDAQEHALWQGYRAWALDDMAGARRHWQAAGETGRALQQAGREAQFLLAAFLHGDAEQHSRATEQLADWLHRLPGPRAWRPATGLARSAGMAWLRSDSLGAGFDTLRASPGRPVRLRIAGPVRLRLDVLPLHAADEDLPLDGWLRVRSDDREWISPFSGNRPSTGLRWPGATQRPGRTERRELQLPAGTHDIEIQGVDRELLVRLYREAPLLDLGLSPDRVRQAAPDWQALAAGVGCAGIDGERFIECRAGLVVDDPPPHRHAADHTAPSATATADWQRTVPAPLPPLVPAAAITSDNPATAAPPYQRMVAWLWRLEKAGADADTVIAGMEALAEQSGAPPVATWLRPLLKRASRGADWQVIEYVPESAGVRYVERPANAPDTPALRARAALLDPACRDRRLLSGRDELVYSLYNLRPTTLRLELVSCRLPFAAAAPVGVQVTASGRAPVSLVLPPGEPRPLKLRTGRGEQVVRLRMPDPVVNQFLGVRIHDPSVPAQETTERIYHLATQEEPLRLDIEGPAWLRIDELRDGTAFSRYLAIAEGWQSVQLQPEDGRDEALYRLYRRNAGTAPPPSRRPAATATAEPLPAPFPATPARDARWRSHDDYSLGGQEDGTPGIGLRLVSRTRVDDEEDSDRARFRENFAELRGEYRYFDADANRYWRSEVLGRLREDGNPVLGFGQHLYNWPIPRWPRLQVSAHLTGFVQNPGDELPGRSGGTEWALNASLRALQHIAISPRSYHEPSVTLFGRALSLDRNDRYAGKALDRDVFSRYKADHKRGVRLSEYLVHKPWLDTEWYGQLALTSNENFNLASPDNLETRLGWRQLAGDLDIDAGYRLRYYRSDGDRNSSGTRNDLRLKLAWMRWHPLQRRSELRLFLNHDIDNNESSVFIGLFLHGGKGRGLRDFRGNEVRFADIRERRAPHDANRVAPP